MENKHKHLEFIQKTIERMAGNLFYLRGLTITLVSALFAMFVKEANNQYIFVVYFPVLIFWILDGYFLSQERLFRALYDHVSKLPEKKIDYSMDTRPFQQDERNSWLSSMFSKTLVCFYIPLILIMLAIIFFIK